MFTKKQKKYCQKNCDFFSKPYSRDDSVQKDLKFDKKKRCKRNCDKKTSTEIRVCARASPVVRCKGKWTL